MFVVIVLSFARLRCRLNQGNEPFPRQPQFKCDGAARIEPIDTSHAHAELDQWNFKSDRLRPKLD